MHKLVKGQRGVTGLETAIILIAFVVVASVFAFTVLSTGIFSAERGKETVLAGLEQARGSVELKGSVIANGVVDIVLENADDAWNGATNVTQTIDTTDKKEGTASSDMLVATAFTTGLAAYENLPAPLDLTNYDSISFWVKSSVSTTLGQIELVIDDTTDCASASENIDIPALVASTWTKVTIGMLAATTRSAIQCVGMNVATDLSTAADVTVNMDDLVVQGQVNSVVILIANSVKGEPVDLQEPGDADNDGLADTEDRQHKLVIGYTDAFQIKNDLHWTKSFLGNNDADDLLEEGERVELTVQMKGLDQATPLLKNTDFTVEIKPESGSVLVIQRTTPAKVDLVMNLK